MFIEALLLGLLIGLIRNGKISNISSVYFRGTAFLIAGLVLQIIPILLGYFDLFKGSYAFISFLGVVCMMVCLARNFDKKGIAVIFAGASLNFIAMLMNSFTMPVDFNALDFVGLKSLASTIADGSVVNMTSVENAKGLVKVLSKFIPIPPPYPLAKVVSIGDIVMSIGFLWFMVGELTGKRYLSNIGSGRYRSSYF
jgi:hypothetical protein